MAGFFRRIGFAFKCFFLVLFAGRLPDELPAQFLRGARRAKANDDAGVSTVQTPGRGSPGARPAAAAPPRSTPPTEQPVVDRAVQVLALLQRDGRLVDFLFEDLSAYPDDQVGAAAREVHTSCREVLQRYLKVEPVVDGEEGRTTTVEAGFDPALIKLVGSVPGRPPYRGVIRHRGWRAVRVDLPALADGGGGRSVIAPAEVEIG